MLAYVSISIISRICMNNCCSRVEWSGLVGGWMGVDELNASGMEYCHPPRTNSPFGLATVIVCRRHRPPPLCTCYTVCAGMVARMTVTVCAPGVCSSVPLLIRDAENEILNQLLRQIEPQRHLAGAHSPPCTITA